MLPIIYIVNASPFDDYNEIANTVDDRIENYSSANHEVQIEIFYNKVDNKVSGYLKRLVVCNIVGCKTYNYKPDQVEIMSARAAYFYFKAPVKNGVMTGFICGELSNYCSSRVFFDIKSDGKLDFEAKFLMHDEKTISIKRLNKFYL